MRPVSFLVAVLLAAPVTARAERGGSVTAMTGTSRRVEVVPPGAEPVAPPVPAPVPVIDPLAGAPRPEDAGGVIVPRERPADRPWLRAALFVPRAVVAAMIAPVRFALWAEDNHHVVARTKEVFWNDAGTVGLYPTVGWNFGRDVKGGAVFAHEDPRGAALHARATVGTVERYHVAGAIRVVHGRGGVELSARHRDTAGEGYYGIGDVDEEVSRYGLEETVVRSGVLWSPLDGVMLGVGGSVRQLEFRDSTGVLDDRGIGEVHDLATIPGFETGVEATRGELTVQIDRRHVRYAHQSAAAPSSGWAAELHGGWQHALETGTGFGYGGLDVVRAFDLYRGNRILSLRATMDGTFADRDEVPFVDLPTLGGTQLLRGYSAGRFRDLWAGTASLEYSYPVTDGVHGFVFTDVGRVAADPRELLDDAPRAGFGMGVQVHSRRAMAARVWLASTVDGGLAASIRVEPVFGSRGKEVVR